MAQPDPGEFALLAPAMHMGLTMWTNDRTLQSLDFPLFRRRSCRRLDVFQISVARMPLAEEIPENFRSRRTLRV